MLMWFKSGSVFGRVGAAVVMGVRGRQGRQRRVRGKARTPGPRRQRSTTPTSRCTASETAWDGRVALGERRKAPCSRWLNPTRWLRSSLFEAGCGGIVTLPLLPSLSHPLALRALPLSSHTFPTASLPPSRHLVPARSLPRRLPFS
eukprot:scaffold221403_cov31-Tisochrysis_lutea.AAC.2